jgi:uncharacterized surface anchored protein
VKLDKDQINYNLDPAIFELSISKNFSIKQILLSFEIGEVLSINLKSEKAKREMTF